MTELFSEALENSVNYLAHIGGEDFVLCKDLVK